MHAFVVLAGRRRRRGPTGAGPCSTTAWRSGRAGSGTRGRAGGREWDGGWTRRRTTGAPTPTCTGSRRRSPPPTPWRPPTRDRAAGCAPRRCAARSGSCTASPASATGGCPSTSPPSGRRCPSTTGTGPPTRSSPTASPSGTSSSGRGWPCTSGRPRRDDPTGAGWLLEDAVGPLRRRGDPRLGGRRASGVPVHAGLGRPARRRRAPDALGALRGDRRGDRARRGHRRRPVRAPGRGVARPRRGALRRPGDRQLAPRADPDRRGGRAAPGRGSPTPTTSPRCCCSTAGRCGAASPRPCADAAQPLRSSRTSCSGCSTGGLERS